MAFDFPLAPLRRYLWDNLAEIIIPYGDASRQQHPPFFFSPSSVTGISTAWAAGAGYEGFDNFRVELKKFSGGQSNPTFLLLIHLSPPHLPRHNHARAVQGLSTAAAAAAAAAVKTTEYRFVLRKKPASVKVSSAHAVEREFRVLRALRHTDVPVPAALLLCEDPDVIGTPFYIMEFVNGRVFANSALPGMSPGERAAAYVSAAETLARLHRVDFMRVGLEGYGRSKGGYLVRQVATLEKVARKQAEDAGPIEGFGEIVQDLRELTSGVPDRVTLVHGDFRIDNLVFHPEEPRVIAVLDWELSTLGHPLADLANLCILHHLPAARAKNAGGGGTDDSKPPPLAGLKGLDLEALGIPGQSELMGVYRQAVGRDRLAGVAGRGIAELGLAFVFFKMAVIAHGIKARLSRGVASSASASIVSAMVPMMMRLANEQMSELRRAHTTPNADENKDGGGGAGISNRNVSVHGPQPPLKAVLFDVGGVLSESPLVAIARFEREAHPRPLPPSYVGVAIAAAGDSGLFQRLERGEERLGTRFLERFAEYLCSDQAKHAYVEYVTMRATRSPSFAVSPKESQSLASAASDVAEMDLGDATPEAALAMTAAAATERARTAVAGVLNIDVLELFRRIAAAARVPIPEMMAAVQALRCQGLKVAAVSNDFLTEEGFVLGRPRYDYSGQTEGLPSGGRAVAQYGATGERGAANSERQASRGWGGSRNELGFVGDGGVYPRLATLCDAVVLSSTSGCRKPGRRIYEEACEALGVSPSEALFVDDIRVNVRAAEALGMRTVWVKPGGAQEVRRVIAELEAITGVKVAGYRKGCQGVRRPAGKL